MSWGMLARLATGGGLLYLLLSPGILIGQFKVLALISNPITLFFVVVLFVLVYGISYLLNQIFGTRVISVGTPFRFLILAMALVISFYLVIKRQGVLERKDIFLILLLGGGLVTLFIYLPQIFPEVFKSTANSVLATDPNSPFVIISDVARSTH